MTFFILIFLGFFAGILSSLFGVGGGVIIVPGLYFFTKNFEPQMIIGSSLFLIFCTCLINISRYSKKFSWPPLNFIITMICSTAVGVWLGAGWSLRMDKSTLSLILAVLLILVSLRSLLSLFRAPATEEGTNHNNAAQDSRGSQNHKATQITDSNWHQISLKSLIFISVASLASGIIAGLSGLGGGIILVPVLMYLVKLPLNLVPFYSNIGMLGSTFIGSLRYGLSDGPGTFYSVGMVSFYLCGFLFIGSFIGSKLGIKIHSKLSYRQSQLLFSVLLIFMSVRIILTRV